LVLDTGIAITDLTSVIKRVTDKPFELALTHGHYDHVGSIDEFDHLYMNGADKPLIPNYKGTIIEIKDHHQFDLGGRIIETVNLMGHTPGSIGFLDVTNRLLFPGDAIGAKNAWMQLTNMPLEALLDALKRIKAIQDRWDDIWPGHYNQCDRVLKLDYVLKLKELVQGLVSGTIPIPTEVDELSKGWYNLPFDPVVARLGDVAVTFNPRRIHFV
jgi:glyoxylase-like metal-dependent hydrolase (beta-lactamase superfamily II)